MKKTALLILIFLWLDNTIYAQEFISEYRKSRPSPQKNKSTSSNKGAGLKLLHASQMGISYVQPFEENLHFSVWDFRNNQQPERPQEFEINYKLKNMYKAIYLYLGAEVGFASATATYNDVSYNLSKIYVHAPISVGYRYGGEVCFDQSKKLSFSLGIGLAPAWHLENLEGPAALNLTYKQNNLTSAPFMWADVGNFIGIQAKLRVTYYPMGYQSYTVDNSEHQLNQVVHQAKITSLGSAPLIKFSLLVMPFSGSWGATRW
jgi:hypothetical protein